MKIHRIRVCRRDALRLTLLLHVIDQVMVWNLILFDDLRRILTTFRFLLLPHGVIFISFLRVRLISLVHALMMVQLCRLLIRVVRLNDRSWLCDHA